MVLNQCRKLKENEHEENDQWKWEGHQDHENNKCSRMVGWKPNFRLYTTVKKEAVVQS